ncbi:MAG: MFS transporter [SAR324 cluster bacterium]|nr:MFS transporter [SAR324 cluster bacterium]MCZ6843512.1 MFS transporter [SAR324 cluster bacterium]
MFRNPALLTLWGGEFASRVGESAFQLVLLWYLLEETGSSLNTGLVTMISFLPALLVGVWSGVLVDRWEFRRVLLGADLLRALLAMSLPLLFLVQALPIWMVGLLAFLLNSASAFFNPARDAIIPRLSPPGELVAANSLVQSAWQFSLLLGPFLVALALPFVPTVYLFALVALAFLISMGVLLRLPRMTRAEQSGGGQDAWTAFTVEFRAGLAALWQDRRVFWIWTITVVNNFFLMGAVIVGMPFYVKTHLGGTGTDFALVEGTYAGGMIIATWIIGRYGGRIEPLRLLFLGMVYDGLTYLPLLWVDSLGGTLLTVFVHSLGIPTITISRLTALHRIVPAQVQGRIFSYFNMAVNGMTALSIGVVGLVLIWLPANQLFAAIGLLAASCGVFGLLLPVFRRT